MSLSSSEKEKTFCLKTCYLTEEEREKCMQPFGEHSRKKKKQEGKRGKKGGDHIQIHKCRSTIAVFTVNIKKEVKEYNCTKYMHIL